MTVKGGVLSDANAANAGNDSQRRLMAVLGEIGAKLGLQREAKWGCNVKQTGVL